MEHIMVFLNVLANAVLTVSIVAFILFVCGRKFSKLNSLPSYQIYLVKFGLSLCAAGALYNTLCFVVPSTEELVVSAGLAIIFAWAAAFHYNEYVKPELVYFAETKQELSAEKIKKIEERTSLKKKPVTKQNKKQPKKQLQKT